MAARASYRWPVTCSTNWRYRDLILLGVAKGATRKAGFETLYLNDAAHEFTLRGDSPRRT